MNNKPKLNQISKEILLTEIIFDSICLGIIVVDQNHENILLFNQSFLDLWKIPANLLENSKAATVFNYMQSKTNTEVQHDLAYEIELNDGTYLERNSKTISNQTVNLGVLYSFRNITVRKQLQKQLETQATFDQLTGLANRSLLVNLLQQMIAVAKRNNHYIAVLFIDLDSFKAINDTFGHNTGDQLLKSFGKRLQNLVRTEDIVARLGGDEFIVAIQSQNQQDVSYFNKILERFFKDMTQPYNFTQQEIIVTASVGVSFYPHDGLDADTLIKNADAAMYHAKQKGKSTFQIYNEEISKALLQKIQLEHDLHIAIQKQELFLQYQPIVDLKTNKIMTMEALIRWQHPTLGLVPPDTLIPIAESSGTIFPIGLWVLKTACNQLKAWHDSNLPKIKIAINISECQIKQEDIVPIIKQTLEETKLDPKYVELEITEKVFLSNGNIILEKLFELKKLGININIDDFGTCYSKFAALNRFPMDCIKVDRSLIKSFTDHPELKTIIRAIATVAEGLKLHLIAEGVETKEQLELIKKIFTDQAQGFLFGKPFSTEDATILLKNQLNVK